MDGICSAILNKIYALGGPGRYFIVSEDEFFDEFPEDVKRDDEELKAALKKLSAEGFIDIRYSSGNMYCVALLKTYAPEPMAVTSPPEDSEPVKKGFSPFWAAFAGGAAGGVLTALVSLLLLLC